MAEVKACTSGYDPDSGSLLSDDSVLPDYEREDNAEGTADTLYQACAKNQASSLRRVLERGVTRDEVMELDINGRNGLMLAVAKGFIDIVYGLNKCPYLDINHQDNDGNTALMIAAQAGRQVSFCCCFTSCVSDISQWISKNFLQLNQEKN
uniref:Uncharacterized protein n=1 Tax=Pygocentrus nattereri TaxID=42514 RepID=A0AAR2KPA0_PYGNA